VLWIFFWATSSHICINQCSNVSNSIYTCKILGFHGGDYEECRLMGYKTPVCTSQETHYFSTTESSQLMLCKIWGLHGGDYEECSLLGWYRVAFVRTDISEETIAFMIRVTRIGELGTTLAVTSNRSMFHSDTFLRNVDSYKSHTA
jgi:hypothetical protein